MFFLSCVCYAFVRVWSPAEKMADLLARLIVKLSLSHWYPGSGVVIDCIDS